ncbi:MAG TPA: DUF3703 domain-containing protein [Alcanivorax sp.]|jgi:hypothetical protein|uniref:DUF3703 domain-containing protein n=1 Tax=Alcanivorax jadensis T9 TaxID=1177181 RepID=A0ABR4WEX2_9GAMM|nr:MULTISPECIES: DUF3703 domain-containing protein [Alcanivorax]KGD62076.1 hypothetical protein T9A_01285 [Alcanivorax jadensis T9]MAC15478.1 DUF3703 domain-containing protein [Alcanivorax sp.]MBG31485.1 DUF3703 domain-containing protein [Alcanivorax sp.]MDF1637020.1 DUF3703 domain-containing protein [Alcanivorax jadensis]HBC17187.1 DUF3703 domain-containing protein [Alcanivorax sp.]
MNERQRQAFGTAMSEARLAYRQRRWEQAFALLERAHVLGQTRVTPHVQSHWWMLKVGWQRLDAREVRGQLLRLLAAMLLSRLWVPLGNTGGANVNPLQPMPIADDLRELMETD